MPPLSPGLAPHDRTTPAQRRQFLRYTRSEQWPQLTRYPVTTELHYELQAQMLACAPEAVRTQLDSFRDLTLRGAHRLLADARYRSAIVGLPFADGDRVVAVGDSITADRLGWFDLLVASMRLAGLRAPMRNLGVSGNTTADVLERFDLIEGVRPTHVLLMLGTNDARCHGRRRSHRMVTARETERNLTALTDLITGDLNARVTLITPPPADPSRLATYFADLPLRWHADDIDEVAGVVRKVDPGCIDVHAGMKHANLRQLLEDDGVHPTPAGQRFLLCGIIERLRDR